MKGPIIVCLISNLSLFLSKNTFQTTKYPLLAPKTLILAFLYWQQCALKILKPYIVGMHCMLVLSNTQ